MTSYLQHTGSSTDSSNSSNSVPAGGQVLSCSCVLVVLISPPPPPHPPAHTQTHTLLPCVSSLSQVVRVRFQHIALIASLAGGLAQYHDSLGVGLVDMVLEDVRWGGHRGGGAGMWGEGVSVCGVGRGW